MVRALIPYARKLGIVDIADHDPLVVVHRRNYESSGNLAFRQVPLPPTVLARRRSALGHRCAARRRVSGAGGALEQRT